MRSAGQSHWKQITHMYGRLLVYRHDVNLIGRYLLRTLVRASARESSPGLRGSSRMTEVRNRVDARARRSFDRRDSWRRRSTLSCATPKICVAFEIALGFSAL